jgi:hypothetical protein
VEWRVDFHPDFLPEFTVLTLPVREEVGSIVDVLRIHGPLLKRPLCDTLAGSKYANMKELRFDADDGVWRVAFAFDPQRRAILLVAGDKSGVSQRRFYQTLIAKADARFGDHLDLLKRMESLK